ncbi:MAG: hypothetical protein RBT50_08845 [Bacteroidales bacterium]|nr:hypothetical protein [Bacteroidales bacterium]
MKICGRFLMLAAALLFGAAVTGSSQERCTVLVKEISEKYVGECKKGLAHGTGEARGVDHYTGAFRKGMPHGKGTYIYADSSVYVGMWSKGQRHGDGKYTFRYLGKDSIQDGLWTRDKYMGKNETVQGYKVISTKAMERYRVYRYTDGEEIRVLLKPMTSGTLDVTNLQITGSSGIETEFLNSQMEFRNCEFPFKLRVSFNKWSKLKTVRVDTSIDLEITQPGVWIIEIGA